VEEHVGGPDAEVESTLKQFQEAIAYVLVQCSQTMSVLIIAHPMSQQVSIHGVEFATTQERPLGKDPRYTKDTKYGVISARSKGESNFLPSAPFAFLRLMVLISWGNRKPKVTATMMISTTTEILHGNRSPVPLSSMTPSMRRLNWKRQMWYISG
jgi:hypothetical protein